MTGEPTAPVAAMTLADWIVCATVWTISACMLLWALMDWLENRRP